MLALLLLLCFTINKKNNLRFTPCDLVLIALWAPEIVRQPQRRLLMRNELVRI